MIAVIRATRVAGAFNRRPRVIARILSDVRFPCARAAYDTRERQCRRVEWWFGDRLTSNRSPNRERRSGEIEAIEAHDLVPRSHEVTHELLLGVVTCVDLRDGSELGVRAEDEVDGGACALDLAGGAVATLEHVLRRDGCLPLRAHVEQIHEEV